MRYSRWVRVDTQRDAVQRELFRIDFDVLDVLHDQFIIAVDAWAQCCAGQVDSLGQHRVQIREIAGNTLKVGPLEAIDGTPIVDLKPVLGDSADS